MRVDGDNGSAGPAEPKCGDLGVSRCDDGGEGKGDDIVIVRLYWDPASAIIAVTAGE